MIAPNLNYVICYFVSYNVLLSLSLCLPQGYKSQSQGIISRGQHHYNIISTS